jgi:hypothetical protein
MCLCVCDCFFLWTILDNHQLLDVAEHIRLGQIGLGEKRAGPIEHALAAVLAHHLVEVARDVIAVHLAAQNVLTALNK